MPTGNRALDIRDFLDQDRLAVQISNMYQEWENYRSMWLAEQNETRQYIFATDTGSTSVGDLPWKNSVHIPKLCQIRDNLHANYRAALFPNDQPISWEGDDESSELTEKRQKIEAYMSAKMRQASFSTEVSKLVLDWIDYGNCFAIVEFLSDYTTDPVTGEKIRGYTGPRVRRINPADIVFNPTAPSFTEAPKIVRSLKTLGTLHTDVHDKPEMQYMQPILKKLLDKRGAFNGLSDADFKRNTDFAIDGFSSFVNYFQSNYVEILEFHGDLFDTETGTLHKNQIITIVDRSWVIRSVTNPSWLGQSPIFHCGWRLRPDNLYAMGPLDNLVGMQYRIDHLENAKSDAFDLIVHPVMKVTGFVEDFDYGPGERIFVGDEGDVEFMAPDVTALNADTQIALYEQKMEEMAGAPKQAMGFRTPGEKTAYEVQILENGSNRVFLNKTAYFEEEFLEPILNSMLEIGRRNMDPSERVKTQDNEFGASIFQTITREDIIANGKIKPIGARHFARNANIIQNLTQLSNSMIGQDPSVLVHISGYELAKTVEELLGLEKFGLVQKNIRIAENMETEQLKTSAANIIAEQQMPLGGSPVEAGMVQAPQNA